MCVIETLVEREIKRSVKTKKIKTKKERESAANSPAFIYIFLGKGKMQTPLAFIKHV